MLYINYVLCWRYIIHVLIILCWHVFCFPKKTCFIYIKLFSLIQKHSSITLTWGCLCGKGMPFWRIKGVPFMRCISTHKWIWSRLCGRRVMRRHIALLSSNPYINRCSTVYWMCFHMFVIKPIVTKTFHKDVKLINIKSYFPCKVWVTWCESTLLSQNSVGFIHKILCIHRRDAQQTVADNTDSVTFKATISKRPTKRPFHKRHA